MNWLTIAIIVIVGILTYLGFKRGLIKSLVPFVGIALGVIIAGRFYSSLADSLPVIDSESQANIVAFIILLIVTYIVVHVTGSFLHRMIRLALLGWADKLGGLVFGFATGWLITLIVVVLMARFVALPAELPDIPVAGLDAWIENWREIENFRDSVNGTIDGSSIAKVQIKLFPAISNLLPSEFDAVKDFFD
jgi:membrane protein required for colicin V production